MKASRVIAYAIIMAPVLFLGFGVYSYGWSERFLAPIRVGMSTNEMLALVGPPPSVITNPSLVAWDYTRSWSTDARVYFDANGLVSGIETD